MTRVNTRIDPGSIVEEITQAGNFKIRRIPRHRIELYKLSPTGKWVFLAYIDEREAADFNNRLDGVLKR